MKIIDKYLVKEFFKYFLLCSFAFPFVFIVADLVNKLGKFQDVAGKWILLYYVYQLPYIVVLIVPFAVLISVLLSLGGIAKFSEVIAMKASGISLYRISIPIMWVAFFIYIFTLLVTNFVIPVTNYEGQKIERLKIKKQISVIDTPNRVHLGYKGNLDEGSFYLYIRYFDGKLLKINDLKLFYFDDDGKIMRRVDAKHAKWDEDQGWIGYSGVIIRVFQKDQKGIEIERMASGPIDFFLRPEDLARVKIDAENLSFFQLRNKIRDLRKSGENVTKLLVELNLKISYPFTNVIIALIAIPFGANVTKRGLAKGFGIGLIIVIIFLTLVKFGITLGSGGALPPVLSAWIANIIFAVIGVYLFQKAKM